MERIIFSILYLTYHQSVFSFQLASCPNCSFYVERELSVWRCVCLYESDIFKEAWAWYNKALSKITPVVKE